MSTVIHITKTLKIRAQAEALRDEFEALGVDLAPGGTALEYALAMTQMIVVVGSEVFPKMTWGELESGVMADYPELFAHCLKTVGASESP